MSEHSRNSYESPEEAAVVAHLLVRLNEDWSSGALRSAEEYAATYPDHIALVQSVVAAFLNGHRQGAAIEAPPIAHARQFGRYRLLRELGRGGQGEVHLAEDSQLGRRVAVKLLLGMSALDESSRERFRREALVTSRLNHPGLCTVFELGQHAGVDYLAMRYVEGESLAELMARRANAKSSSSALRRGELERDLQLMEQIARAVHAAHEAGVLHRDLKPRNIMIGVDGHPVVLDFGLARDLQGEAASLTRSGDVLGTPHYMAPEQLLATHSQDRGTDVWALGVMLFEMVCGQRPFEAPTREALYRRILEGQRSDPRRLRPGLPRDLAVVLATALETSLARRYGTALLLAEELERVRHGEPILARPPSLGRKTWRWIRKHPSRSAAVVTLIAAIGSSGYLVARWPELESARARELEQRFERSLEEAYLTLATENHTQAQHLFETLLEERPSSAEALAGALLAMLETADYETTQTWIKARRADTQLEPTTWALLQRFIESDLRESSEATFEPSSALQFYLAALADLGPGHAVDVAGLKRAQANLERCILLSPTARALYHYELAHVQFHLGDDSANDPVRLALATLWPKEWQARYWIARLRPYEEAATALAELEPLARIRSDDWIIREAAAVCCYRCRRFADAERWYREARQLNPSGSLISVGLARTLDRLNRRSEGWSVLNEYRQRYGDDPELMAQVGNFLNRDGRYSEARATLKPLVQDARPLLDAGISLAFVLMNQQQLDEAREILNRLQSAYPEHPDVLRALAQLEFRFEDFEAAAVVLRRARILRPLDAEILADLGTACSSVGDRRGAHEAWNVALQIDPDHIEVLSKLAWHWAEEGAFVRAAELHWRHSKLAPDEAAPAFRAAQAWANASDHMHAAEAYRRATEIDPEWAEAWCNLGQELRRAGDFDASVAALQRGHELGSARADWGYPSAAWLARAREAQTWSLRLEDPATMNAVRTPEDRCALAEVAFARGQHSLAVELFEAAFNENAELRSDLAQARRVLAARAALNAAMEPAAKLTAPHWRTQAHAWLEEELDARLQALSEGRSDTRRTLQVLQRWVAEPSIADALSDMQVSTETNSPWQALHARMNQTIQDLRAQLEPRD